MAFQLTKPNSSIGCTILFLLPFLLGGLGAIAKGIFTYYNNPSFTEEVLAMFGVGTIFCLVGGGMLVAVYIGRRNEQKAERLKSLDPAAPWRWRADWITGRVQSSAPAAMLVYWLFGLVFGGVGLIILFDLEEISRKGPMGYLTLLFPLFGAGILGAAVYSTLRWVKYGQSHCDLVTNPGVAGGWFRAVVWARLKEVPPEGVVAQLTCYHCYVSGSGKNRTAHRKVKWQETLVIQREFIAQESDGTMAMPFRVYVPYDVKPTTPGKPENRTEWELSTKAEVSGIDFSAQFIVPLFVTEDSSQQPPDEADDDTLRTAKAPYNSTILVTEQVDELELYAPPRRNLSMAFSVTLFAVIWSAIIAGMLYSGEVPMLFPIVFGFFDLLLLSAAFWLCFGTARVTFRSGEVQIRKKALGMGTDVRLPLTSIQGADAHITMQSGDVPYYTIRLLTKGGRRNTVGGIKNKDEANDLVALIQSRLAGTASPRS